MVWKHRIRIAKTLLERTPAYFRQPNAKVLRSIADKSKVRLVKHVLDTAADEMKQTDGIPEHIGRPHNLVDLA